MQQLMQSINYEFKDASLLKQALTHRSCGGDHNERLEFLGDAVVNFVIGEILYRQYTDAAEGELSRWRASLVNRETLADLARNFNVGDFLFLGQGELRSGGKQRTSILSCAMEAIIGAIYLDAGFETVYTSIASWYQDLINSLSSVSSHKDPKTLLQEYLQSQRMPLPVYKVETVAGEAHKQTFSVSCQVTGIEDKTFGEGTSRRRAEQDAAQAMLEVLQK